jgi:hypothetical protein
VAAPDRCVLKGALALDFRLGDRTRTTKDMDLVRSDAEESATADLIAAQSLDLGDFFVFAVEKSGGISEDEEGGSVRYRVRAELAGRIFEEVTVDIGFSDPLSWQPESVSGPDLLTFADIQPAEVPALPLEQHVAEKLHAYTRIYGQDHPSSRVKDLVDLVLVKRYLPLNADRLRVALLGTFEARRLQSVPARLLQPPKEWAVPYRRLAHDVGIDPDLSAGHADAAALLDPVLGGLASGNWDPERGAWVEPEPYARKAWNS